MKERKTPPPTLGSREVVEDLVRRGRVPVFHESVTIYVNGVSRTRVPCTIPGEDGQEPTEVFLYPQNATQIRRRVEQAMKDRPKTQ